MDEVNIVLGALAALALAAASGFFWKRKNIAAHLSPVRRELKKEKAWLRRGEYNAAMVKGRQNLELLLKLVAEFHGIQLDNTAQAVANAKAGPEKNVFLAHRRQGRRVKKVMTHQQFGWWLDANGYLDRVGKWELNEIRLIGNKAVHENYASKEDAWSQYNYLEDVFKLISEKNAGHERKATDAAEKKRNEGAASCEAKKQMVPAAKKETQKNKTKKKEAKQKEPAKPEQPEAGKAKQKKKKQKTAAKQEAVKNQEAPKKQETAKKQEPPKSQEPAEKKLEEKKQEEKKQAEQAPVKLSASAKRRARRKRAKARQAQAQQAAASQEKEARKEPACQVKKKADAAASEPKKKAEADRPQEKPEAGEGPKKRRRPRRRKPKPQAAGNGGVNEAAN